MRNGLRIVIVLVVASLALTLVVAGLLPKPSARPAKKPAEKAATAMDWSGTYGTRVLVLGHSFARDWFASWGADPNKPHGRAGVWLALADLDRRPGGARAAASYASAAPKGVVAFLVLGPEALKGGSSRNAESSVSAALAEVDSVAKATRSKGMRLVVAGPLPSLPSDTDAHLVRAQKAYLAGLKAREDKGVLNVFDVYDQMTTAGQATLVRGFALTQESSRLGPAGYAAFDAAFFRFVKRRL